MKHQDGEPVMAGDGGYSLGSMEAYEAALAKRNASWVTFNPLTNTYDTKDGTKIPAELAENVHTLADAIYIAHLREQQRTKNDL